MVLFSSGAMRLRDTKQAGRLLQRPRGKDAGATPEPPTDKDALRVQRAQAGDQSVWEEWYQDYYRPLFRYAYLRLRSRLEAEDTVAQVFVEAYRGIGRYRHSGKPLLAWLYRIAHNVTYDRLKAASRRPEQAEEAGDQMAFRDGPEANLISMDLANAIEALTPEQRDVIVLRYFMSMSSVEVGAALGKTQPAVFSLQSRALASLRSKLDGVMEL